MAGQLIDVNGTMTGGGTIQRKGQVRLAGPSTSSSTPSETQLTVEENEQLIRKLEAELNEKRKVVSQEKVWYRKEESSLVSNQSTSRENCLSYSAKHKIRGWFELVHKEFGLSHSSFGVVACEWDDRLWRQIAWSASILLHP